MSVSKRYLKEFSVVMGLYAVLLPVSLVMIKQGAEGLNKIAWALLPALPLLALIIVVAREIKRMDEFQQKVHLLSFGLTLAITGALTTLWGFLEIAGLPALSIIYVFPFMVSTWGVINTLLMRYYTAGVQYE